MVLDSVASPHSRRNYAKALDDLFAFSAGRPLSRALLMEYRATMDALSPSTVNVRLSAVRKMVLEARKNGMIGAEEAANLTEVPNIPQKGTRLGNWLTREQAKELLAVPDRATLAILVGCVLRRQELAVLDVDTIQLREGRWVLAGLEGKGSRVRTVAIRIWVKQRINAWMTAAGVEDGRLLRAISKGGKVKERMSGWSLWSVVEQCARRSGSNDSEPMTCGGRARSSVGRPVVIWNKSSSCWDTARSKPRNAILALSGSSSRRSTIRWDSERSRANWDPI
jgi:site-specific recombinase XerC